MAGGQDYWDYLDRCNREGIDPFPAGRAMLALQCGFPPSPTQPPTETEEAIDWLSINREFG